jgi:formyl-CoA transferase
VPGGALNGIRVVELASYVTGPYAAALLADLGADVVKVEDPSTGDPFRGWGEDGYSPTFRSVNRNKRSLAVDLKTELGRAAAGRLVETADVLIENFRPGVADRLGIGYAETSRRNPRLVYCSITGFGSDGPYRDRPGYDTVGQATSGLLSLLTDLDDPRPMGISLADHLAGVFACYGVLAALVARERTGEGQLVETSLLQATIAFLGENAARYLDSGQVPDRESRTRLAQVYAFRAGDGLPFIVHLSSPPKFWEGLAYAVARPELVEDPRFRTRADRARHYAELRDLLAVVFSRGDREEWLRRLGAADVPCAPLNTLEEALADPQVRHLGLLTSIEHPARGLVQLMGSGIRLEKTPPALRLPPPTLGEHTQELLAELGLSGGERVAE